MLTESELAWYDLRPYDGTAWCYHCPQLGQNCSTSPFCPLINADMEDALEFSERVAAKLAKHIHNKPLVCETNWDCPYWPQGKCAWCYLKAARLDVEEEMDADIQAKDKAIQDFC